MPEEGLQAIHKLRIISGGYAGEEIGEEGMYVSGWTNIPYNGSVVSNYYYRDSDTGNNARSARIRVWIEDSWNTTRFNDNTLKLEVRSRIIRIEVDQILGVNPAPVRRDHFARRERSGAWRFRSERDNVNHVYVMHENIDLGVKTYWLAPLQEQESSTVYYRGNSAGHTLDTPPSMYIDEMWMGIRFRNTLPPDYRPGDRKVGTTWQSHNRINGKCHRKFGSWNELRTVNGGVGEGDPPNIKTSNVWKNQKKIGANA